MKTNKPWEFLESREKKYGLVLKTRLFGLPTVVVTSPKLIFTNHSKLVPSSVKKLLGERSLEGDQAKRFRHILLAFLGPGYVGRMQAMIQKHVEESWIAGGEIKAYHSVKEALYAVVYDLFLSLTDEKEQQELLDPFRVVLHALLELPLDFPGTQGHGWQPGDHGEAGPADGAAATGFAEREGVLPSEQQDLLSVLLVTKGEDGRRMTDEEIKQNILMLHLDIAAGEPLSIADVRRMKYTWRVVQEGMRFVPPTIGVFRRAIVDFVMGGYTVPQGWRIPSSILCLCKIFSFFFFLLPIPAETMSKQLFGPMYQSNKKEKFFPEAESFKPDRFLGTGPVLTRTSHSVEGRACALVTGLPRSKNACFCTTLSPGSSGARVTRTRSCKWLHWQHHSRAFPSS
ncbi:hypothetical protein SELMODRAFT_431878 [Selaginella moellendorffii]|uniref:Uncharacterized protein CYP716P2 n=1 Tax=Selaginella moellendorffii TaxID=88036 RepID=D8TE25_SELML|nr:hypothetical protein SELMODRAFT_431878 [Selaginella moellendorffii]